MQIEDHSINNSLLSILSCAGCSPGLITTKNLNTNSYKDFQDAPIMEEYEAVLSGNDVNFLT